MILFNQEQYKSSHVGRTQDMGIEVKDLTKTYKLKRHQKKLAVDNISFTIPTGEIVGFIGPNGAGKSTTIKMMTGILVPDSGTVSIDGLTFKKNRKEIMLKTGVVFGQKSVLCWDIPVIDSLKLFKDMYRVSEDVFRTNMDSFSDILGLDEFISQPPRLLSLGQRMKADLAASLIYNPDILFLDEPMEAPRTSNRTFWRERFSTWTSSPSPPRYRGRHCRRLTTNSPSSSIWTAYSISTGVP